MLGQCLTNQNSVLCSRHKICDIQVDVTYEDTLKNGCFKGDTEPIIIGPNLGP